MTSLVGSHRRSEFIEGVLGAWSELRIERDEFAWRQTRDPWLTLIAEFMLAQTQVARVAQRFVSMADRFPTPQSCADASQAEVVALWVGLGYNRRAVALHKCARIICEQHGGSVPSDLDQLLKLPGVGPYTARAVRAFAFDEQAGVVDTNIKRVLARALIGRDASPIQTQELADELVDRQVSRDWNLALMDFGSLVCRARAPQCAICPLFPARCKWRQDELSAGLLLIDPASSVSVKGPRQSTFSGSDRQGRGRLVRSACLGPISPEGLADAAGWPEEPERAQRIAERLVTEGVLARTRAGSYQLA
ncbi:MAG TPA: A/G-specific adenine glycosylase [Acidimicrobiales bacterium]|nr:A/G-specific adenine glycosylase [Acidimicrobiales bacterium]